MVETIQKTQTQTKKPSTSMKGMEHNLVKYTKYYSYKCIKILKNSEFTRETYHSIRDFSGHW